MNSLWNVLAWQEKTAKLCIYKEKSLVGSTPEGRWRRPKGGNGREWLSPLQKFREEGNGETLEAGSLRGGKRIGKNLIAVL